MHEIPLKTKEVRFTGGLRIVEGVGLIRETDPSLPAFVGAPSPNIDAAWEDIVNRPFLSRPSPIQYNNLTITLSFKHLRNGKGIGGGQTRNNSRP